MSAAITNLHAPLTLFRSTGRKIAETLVVSSVYEFDSLPNLVDALSCKDLGRLIGGNYRELMISSTDIVDSWPETLAP